MRRRPLLLLPLLLSACHRETAAPPAAHVNHAQATQAAAPRAEAAAAAESGDSASGAADVLRRYYGLIERGKYDEAWKMRAGGRGIDAAQFAAHFRAYQSYHSEVGTPSRPVASDGWVYVEVPVMTTGRFVAGKPFGSSGSVTLRRPAPGTGTPADQAGWHIYTG